MTSIVEVIPSITSTPQLARARFVLRQELSDPLRRRVCSRAVPHQCRPASTDFATCHCSRHAQPSGLRRVLRLLVPFRDGAIASRRGCGRDRCEGGTFRRGLTHVAELLVELIDGKRDRKVITAEPPFDPLQRGPGSVGPIPRQSHAGVGGHVAQRVVQEGVRHKAFPSVLQLHLERQQSL